ncbi:MAG: cell division protein FtsB [Cocleimonas sp.]|jgi:cell division protein FtsB
MKALLIIFSLLLVLLIGGLWVGPGSYPDRWRLDDRTVVQEQENKAKQDQINKIQAELDDVSSSKDALEERARSELGMTKKGETFFEVIMQPDEKKRKQNVAEESDSNNDEKSSSDNKTN